MPSWPDCEIYRLEDEGGRPFERMRGDGHQRQFQRSLAEAAKGNIVISLCWGSIKSRVEKKELKKSYPSLLFLISIFYSEKRHRGPSSRGPNTKLSSKRTSMSKWKLKSKTQPSLNMSIHQSSKKEIEVTQIKIEVTNLGPKNDPLHRCRHTWDFGI